MPHIRLRGLKAEHARQLSQTLASQLAPILETTVDNFTVELVETQFFDQGQPAPGYPFCEVLWFARSDAHKQRCAEWLTSEIKRLTLAADVAVVFFAIPRTDYFENGRHF